jgi:FtsZ-binding cell division protein ZapB
MCDSYTELNEDLTTENNQLAAETKELLRTRGELRDANQGLQKRCAELQVAAAEAVRKANTANQTLTTQVRGLPL